MPEPAASSAGPSWRIVPLTYGYAVLHPTVAVGIYAETLDEAARIAATPPVTLTPR